jgi:hypothetical protein
MNRLVFLVAILAATVSCAFAETWWYDPPMYPGDYSVWRSSSGDRWLMDPPLFPGDTLRLQGPRGENYRVTTPMYPGDSYRIDR